MLVAPRAVLAVLYPARMLAAVLRFPVVAGLALRALKGDLHSHVSVPSSLPGRRRVAGWSCVWWLAAAVSRGSR